MYFMNEYDIECAVRECTPETPVKFAAVKTLVNLVNWTNSNSDGWAYWPKPCRAAKRLMMLIEGDRTRPRYERVGAEIDPAAYRKSLAPIKAFRTRMGADFEIMEV